MDQLQHFPCRSTGNFRIRIELFELESLCSSAWPLAWSLEELLKAVDWLLSGLIQGFYVCHRVLSAVCLGGAGHGQSRRVVALILWLQVGMHISSPFLSLCGHSTRWHKTHTLYCGLYACGSIHTFLLCLSLYCYKKQSCNNLSQQNMADPMI